MPLHQLRAVEAVMPSRTVDVMATLTSSQSTARVSSFRPGELNQPIVLKEDFLKDLTSA